MASLNRYTKFALATVCSATSIILPNALAQEESEPDPWFTQEHQRPEAAAEKKSAPPSLNNEEEASPTAILKRSKPTVLVRKIKRTLANVPANNLQKRITLLEEIVSTSNPQTEDVELLDQLRKTRSQAIQAIERAGNSNSEISGAIEKLGSYSDYYKGDPSLLMTLLRSEFAERLSAHASALGRRGENEELANIETLVLDAGLSTIFGQRIAQSATIATSSMIARRLEDLSNSAHQLPGEAYLISRMLNQDTGKIRLAIDLPDGADPRLANNITRSIERQWGDHIQTTSLDKRSTTPELVLSIAAASIHSSNTLKEAKVRSTIPGAVVEKENPDFQEVVQRYEKAARQYQDDLESYEYDYEYYLEEMDDTEYRDAQNNLRDARNSLAATEGGGAEEEDAINELALATAEANATPPPIATEPMPPNPRHLKILEEIYLIPSTLIISEKEKSYEYTQQEMIFTFETEAPVSLKIPQLENIESKSTVTLSQNRKWTKNLGVHTRDPQATDGSYSEREYEAALDIFGLEFGASCSQALTQLLQKAETQLRAETTRGSLEQSLLALALQSVTSQNSTAPLSQAELQQLANLAQDKATTAEAFRAKCLATLLSKTQFAHLANEEEIRNLL